MPQRRDLIFSATRSVRGRGFGLPPRGCAAYVNVLASFMSERATGNVFGSTSCVGGVGTSVAFLYSVAATLLHGTSFFAGYGAETYFDTSTTIIGLVLVGRYLEARAKGPSSPAATSTGSTST